MKLRALNPFARLKRWHAGQVAQAAQRYAAAQLDHMTGGWMPVAQDINELILRANPVVRERCRQLVRDFPPFARAVNAIVAVLVGGGIKFQSRVVDHQGKPDRRVRQLIEDKLALWGDECADVAGSDAFRMSFPELTALAKRQELESGEFLGVVRRHKDPAGKILPFGLAFYDTDRLTEFGARVQGKNTVHGGVEVDPRYGAIEAFHISDEGYGRPIRIPAKDVFFGFHRQRIGQVRGITPFAPAMLLAGQLANTVQAEISAAQLAAKWLAIVETPNPGDYQAARNLDGSTATTAAGKKIEALENAMFEYLQPGEKIEFKAGPQRGGDAFAHLVRFLLRLVSITGDLPYEIVSGDYTGVNYATLRVSRNDYIQQIQPQQQRHTRHLVKPCTEWALDQLVLHGRLRLPGYWTNPWRYRRGVYVSPGMKPVDPLKEIKADVEAIKAKMKSPQQVILERGGDPDTVLDELEAWTRMCAERGLDPSLDGIGTATANNPAAVFPDEDGRAKHLKAVK